jgi:hypothetical protein
MEPSCQIRAHLRITGDFDPDEVTNMLGINPHSAWRKGDSRPQRANENFSFSNWSIGVPKRVTPYLDEVVEELMTLLADKADHIARFCILQKLNVSLVCVLEFDIEETPAVTLSDYQVAWLSSIGAGVDIDIYPKH